MSERTLCTATTKSGDPCSAMAWRDGLCMWHHPAKAADMLEARRQGGRSRSNAARAKKRFRGTEEDLATLWSLTMNALAKTFTGQMEPGQANAVANLVRAAQSLSSTVILSSELDVLRKEVAEIRRSQGVVA